MWPHRLGSRASHSHLFTFRLLNFDAVYSENWHLMTLPMPLKRSKTYNLQSICQQVSLHHVDRLSNISLRGIWEAHWVKWNFVSFVRGTGRMIVLWLEGYWSCVTPVWQDPIRWFRSFLIRWSHRLTLVPVSYLGSVPEKASFPELSLSSSATAFDLPISM